MFDSSPSNLPVEPTPAPQPVPRRPQVQTPTPMTTSSGTKEPEDIFSGMAAEGGGGAPAGAMEEVPGLEDRPSKPIGKILAVVFVLLLLLGGAGGGVYYFLVIRLAAQEEARALAEANANKIPTTTQPTTPIVNNGNGQIPTPIEEPIQQEPVTPDPAPTNTVSPDQVPSNIPLPTTNQPAPVPAPVLTSTIDTDADGLTDAEELALGTDARVADSDGDGFSDSAEVKGLFSPAGKDASITSMSSIKAVKWSSVGFLMPSTWNLVDQTENSAIIQTTNGERFTLALYPASAATSMQGESFKTKNGNQAMVGSDGVSGDVVVGNWRFVIAPEDSTLVSAAYRTLIYMILQSTRAAQ